MMKSAPEVIICLILFGTIGALVVISNFIASGVLQNSIPEFDWLIRGLHNIVGYSTVFLPGYFIYSYIRNINYLEKPGNNCFKFILRKCFEEDKLIDHYTKTDLDNCTSRTLLHSTLLLSFYFMGLQVSYLTWGVLQEKIMTQTYTNVRGDTGRFTNSQFLVFVNRVLAFCMSGMIILCTKQPRHKSPLYKYVFCSFSNILSSWCQYEALKYVSFLYQVLSKSAKTVPVLLMGRILWKTKYEYYEYGTVTILSGGMLIFILATENDDKSSVITTFSGLILLCSYIMFDSFTSNWQGVLFRRYRTSPVQMMCAVNMFSIIFTIISLLPGGFASCIQFMVQFPSFSMDCLFLSVCSAAGQLFVFRTMASFGPLVFAIITTVRQVLAILLSCIIYGHHINPTGMFGVTLIFFSVFLRIYCAYRIKYKHVHGAVI